MYHYTLQNTVSFLKKFSNLICRHIPHEALLIARSLSKHSYNPFQEKILINYFHNIISLYIYQSRTGVGWYGSKYFATVAHSPLPPQRGQIENYNL